MVYLVYHHLELSMSGTSWLIACGEFNVPVCWVGRVSVASSIHPDFMQLPYTVLFILLILQKPRFKINQSPYDWLIEAVTWLIEDTDMMLPSATSVLFPASRTASKGHEDGHGMCPDAGANTACCNRITTCNVMHCTSCARRGASW